VTTLIDYKKYKV